MKSILTRFFAFAALTCLLTPHSYAQQDQKPYPASFTITADQLKRIMHTQAGAVLEASDNGYLDGSSVKVNTINGDMHFVSVELRYFRNARLNVQQNGSYTTQVFVLSSDKSVFYRGEPADSGMRMVKCEEDEIVSE